MMSQTWRKGRLLGIVLAGWLGAAGVAQGQVATRPAAATRPVGAATASATQPATLPDTPARVEYRKLVEAYLTNAGLSDVHAEKKDSKPYLQDELRNATKGALQLTQQERMNLEYIRRTAPELRPAWWVGTKSPTNTSFEAIIWGRPTMTNFVPTEELGAQAPIGIKNGKLVTVVTWRPGTVDSQRDADGILAKRLKIKKGDIGEVVVWHELGHLFITSALSASEAMDLYENYRILYAHLQEFFADMTVLHHGSPVARRAALMLRLDELDPPFGRKYRELEPHTRAAHGIGAAFLAEVLSDPKKWPGVHLPPTVPVGDVELKTIVYVYTHFNTDWSVEEDRALREWALRLVKGQGDAIFRAKGMVPLGSKLTFSLMEAQDREWQKKRNAWVEERLKKAIAAGLADKPTPTTATPVRPAGFPGMPGLRIEVPEE